MDCVLTLVNAPVLSPFFGKVSDDKQTKKEPAHIYADCSYYSHIVNQQTELHAIKEHKLQQHPREGVYVTFFEATVTKK